MTNEKDRQNEQIESLLRKARLSEPSSELKGQITTETRRVWSQTSQEGPWRIPIKRLVASVAAAVSVVWIANISSDNSVARWQTSAPLATRQQPSELEVLPEMPYGPFVKHLTSIRRGLPATNGSGLRRYVETVRKLLDEVQQNDASKPTAPIGGRSRVYPDRSRSISYS